MRALVIGIGNPDRGDDAAGLEAVERLRERVPSDVAVCCYSGEPITLIDLWVGCEAAVVVDATQSAAEAGSVHRFEAHLGPLPAHRSARGTHAFPLASVIELARTLDRLPSRLVIIGIEGDRFGFGEGLSRPVTVALPTLIETVLEELQPALGRPD